MSITVDAIRFRHLAAQLTAPETTQFICKLSTLNSNILSTALFHYITQLPSNREDDVDTITDLISNIILSRKKTPEAIPIIQLNELPYALIAATASFLDQRDYSHLSECSRSLFIGCNAPNQMQRLDLLNITDYSNIILTRFPSIQTLNINLSKMDQLSHHYPIAFSQLKFITLDHGINSEIDTLMEDVLINTQNLSHLTHVTLCNMMSTSGLSQLLNHFQNMSYLRFHRCYMYDDNAVYNVNDIPFIPKLRGLTVAWMDDDCQKMLIHAFAHQLECLELGQGPEDDYDLSCLEFPKLEELTLDHPSYNTITNITTNAQRLRQIDLDPRYGESEDGDEMYLSLEELSSTIAHMLEACHELEHLAINGYSDTIEATLEGIESGVLRTLKRKRKSLQIVVWMHSLAESDEWNESIRLNQKALTSIERIAIAMDESDTTQFMLLAGTESRVKIDKTNLPNSLKTILRNDNISIKGDEYNMCIVNKECKMEYYNVMWKLSTNEPYD
eukprot:136771_1